MIAVGYTYRTDRPAAAEGGAGVPSDPALAAQEALDAVARSMEAIAAELRGDGREAEADILEVGALIARDQDLRSTMLRHTAEGLDAKSALSRAVGAYAEQLAALGDPTLAERAADVRQVGKRAVAWLDGVRHAPPPKSPVVLIGHEIGAADLLEVRSSAANGGESIAAALSVVGGPTSHAAVVARSLGIPLLVGVEPTVLELPDGQEVAVDGERGTIEVNPSPAVRAAAARSSARLRALREDHAAERALPVRTRDDHAVTLRANVATAQEALAAIEAHAEGAGLVRTELPFLEADHWPTQDEHAAALAPVLRPLALRAATVRILDFADDKLPPFLAEEEHAGRGGLERMLAHPQAVADQLRAVLGEGGATDLSVMIPTVANVEQLRACRSALRRAAVDQRTSEVPLGAMVELVEAVEDIEALAGEADFLSLGTNDLTCQVLGLDRRDPAAIPAMAAHPRVLRAIAAVTAAARHHGRKVSACGDAAADPRTLPLLIGLGCEALSVAPSALDEVRYRIRRLALEDCVGMAERAQRLESPEQVWELAEEEE